MTLLNEINHWHERLTQDNSRMFWDLITATEETVEGLTVYGIRDKGVGRGWEGNERALAVCMSVVRNFGLPLKNIGKVNVFDLKHRMETVTVHVLPEEQRGPLTEHLYIPQGVMIVALRDHGYRIKKRPFWIDTNVPTSALGSRFRECISHNYQPFWIDYREEN